MAAMEALPRTPGASFAPEDADLLTLYLGPKIAGEPLPSTTAPYIHDLDVYAAEPAELVSGLLHASEARNGGKEWYFYTSVLAKSSRDSRRCRTVGEGAGTWHSEKARQEIVDQEEDRVIGYRQSFTYEPKNGWLMTEYSLVGQEGGRGQAMPVLCKIYRSPKSISASSMSGSKKRKAAVAGKSAGSSGRVRRRLQFAIAPAPDSCPVVAPAASLDPIEVRADKIPEESQGTILVPVQPQTEQPEGFQRGNSASSISGSKKRKAAVAVMELPGAGLSGHVRRRLDFPFPPPTVNQARAEKTPEESQGAFLVPIESETEHEHGAFLAPIELQREQESAGLQRGIESQQEQLAPMALSRTSLIARLPLDPIEARADKIPEESQGAFLVPTEPQTEQPEGLQREMESQQEPLASMASSRTSSIARMPTDIRRAIASALASMDLPFEDFATADEIIAHYGSIFPYELNCSNAKILPSNSAGVWGFPPSAPTSYSTMLSCPAQYWDTQNNSYEIDASTLPGNGNFLSSNEATPGMSCYGATPFLSDGAGVWATPPSARELPADSWTGGCCQIY
ncbi:unnamed protein product [Alopecurus aequalis]